MRRILLVAVAAVIVVGALVVGVFFLMASPGDESQAGCPEFSPSSVEVEDPDSLQQASDDYQRFAAEVTDSEVRQHLTTLATFYAELSTAASGSGPITVTVDEASEATAFVEQYLSACDDG